MKRKRLVLGLACAIPLLLVGLSAAGGDDADALAYTETVVRRDLFSSVSGTGMIQPRAKVDISADISGRVVELAVREGQWVERDDLLLRIDATRQRSALYRAQAAVAQAQASAEQVRTNWLQARGTLARAEQLASGRGWVTGAELDQLRSQAAAAQAQLRAAEFAVQQAQASYAEAQDVVDKTIIRAPMSGRVTRLNIDEGETAVVGTMNNPGSLLLTIADLSAMEARIRVDETDVPRIQIGARATVRIDAFPRKTFPGRVAGIANSASRAGGGQSAHFQVVIALDSTAEVLHPELSATADVVTDQRRGVVSIPILALTARLRDGTRRREGAANALRPGGGEEPLVEGVFVVDEDDVVRFVPVRIGIAGKRHFEITGGLRGGETVVAGSYQLVRDLEEGDVVERAAPAPAAAPRAAVAAARS